MFHQYQSEVLSFDSKWNRKFNSNEIQTQTDSYKIAHRGISIKRYKNINMQTEEYLFVEENITLETDDGELLNFLNKTVPLVETILSRNQNSKFFVNIIDKKSDTDHHRCLYSLSVNPENNYVKNIQSISWNSSGSVLAAALGEINHTQWCDHNGTGVIFYSLNTLKTASKADGFFDTNSCCNCVKFHHTKASLLVIGTQNGEILVLDRSMDENNQLMASTIGHNIHCDRIEILCWVEYNLNSRMKVDQELFSLSLDGIIVYWNLSIKNNKLLPILCYKITTMDLPKSIRNQRSSQLTFLNCFSGTLCPSDREHFIVGTDVGVLFYCVSRGNNESGNDCFELDRNRLKSPVDNILLSINASINNVQWSKHINSLVVAVSSNGMFYVLDVENRNILSTMDCCQGYLFGVSLSKFYKSYAITCGYSNSLIIYTDVLNNSSNYEIIDETTNKNCNITKKINFITKEEDVRVNCVEFNGKRENIFAFGNNFGTIQIWSCDNTAINLKDN